MRRTAAVAVLTLASGLRADDWPQWLGPDRAGVWNETGLLERFPAGGPPKKWAVPVGQGYAGPAVAGGRVFVLDRRTGPDAPQPKNAFDTGTAVPGDERVRAFDAATGKELWGVGYPCRYKISYAAGPRCTPTVDGDRVYALGAMGDLHCLDAATGAVRWRKQFVADFGATVPVWGFSSHPLVDGDNLICLVGGSDGRLVMAFDKLTGATKWQSLDYPGGDFGYAPPVVYPLGGRRQLVIWHPKAVNGLDPATGKLLWTVPFESKFALTAPTPRADRDRLFVSAFYNGGLLLEVSADAARVVWRSAAKGERPSQTRDLSSIIATPLFAGGHIYGVDSYGELRGLDAATGKRLWATMTAVRGPLTPDRVRRQDGPSETQPWQERWATAFLVPNGDRTVLFNEQGELIFAKLSPAGYDEIDRFQLLRPTNKLAGRPVVWMHPAFAGKCVFARNDEEMVCYDLKR